MKSASKAEWVINNTTLDILNNDPQRLIECTEPGDRVIFKLSGVQKFNRTLVVSHELELISGSSEKAKDEVEYKNSLSFTCPDSGPFLIVNATNITANGFVIENCKKSSGNSIIVIKKRSSAVFENIEISDNNNRAIYIESQSFGALKNSRFNNDGRSRLKGGVVYVASNVSLTISNSSFFGNEAYAGGVLLAYASNVVAIAGSSFSENNASYGGAIYLSFNNVLTVHNSTMSQNKANYNGGAIYFRYNNSIEIENSTISQNNAECGGAIFLANDNTLDVHTSTMSQNNAWYSGGAIYIYDDNSMEIKNSTISQNKAKYNGGAIRLYKNNTLDVHTSTMSRNNASRNGGAVNLNAQSVATINDSTLINNSADSGGALILSTSSSVTIFNTAMKNNSALRDGGALNLNEQSVATITESVFLNNTADSGGALMLSKSCTMTMFNSVLKDNNAKRNGGALNLESQSSAIINESTLTYNSADLGGALILQESSSVTIFKSELENNIAARNGGAFNLDSQCVVGTYESTISKNIAKVDGGAVFATRNSNCSFSNSKLSHNSAEHNGGAMHLSFGNLATLYDVTFEGNTAHNGSSLFLELSATLRITKSRFLNNGASGYATIYASINCIISLSVVTFKKNRAAFGGCFYSDESSLKVLHSTFIENASNKHGGCFHLKSSNASFQNTTISQNNASEDGGAIFATMASVLHMEDSLMFLNQASKGGALRSMLDSRFFCHNCTIKNNTAIGGGGCYIEGSARQILLAQMTSSNIEANNASYYGGGMVVKVLGIRNVDCSNVNVSCGYVLLISTSLVSNLAFTYGGALVVTKQDGVLISCVKMKTYNDTRDFMGTKAMRREMQDSNLKIIDPMNLCTSWQSNRALTSPLSNIIGTFGQTLNMTIDSRDEHQLFGDAKAGFVLSNLLSGREIPKIVLTTLDAFGIGPAPTFYDEAAITLDSNGSFQHSSSYSFMNGSCTIEGIIGLARAGRYEIQLKPTNDGDVLEATNLTLVIRNCTINEEPVLSGAICSKCGEASYNFNLSGGGKCTSCPEGANCSGTYIVPIKGYWHKGPCHDKMKKCIVEKACSYSNRTQSLTKFTRDFTNCNFNDTSLHEFEKTQCSTGYKGRLCGSCNESYGRTSNFQCVKCESVILSVLQLLFITLCLFVTTIIAIKGTLPIASRCLARRDAMTPTHEDVDTTTLEDGTSIPIEEIPQEGSSSPPITTNDAQPFSANISLQLAHGIKKAHGNLVETWKILLNFLQVSSGAIAMDVKWTSKIRSLFENLNFISSATLNAISRPIDCLVGPFSIGARVVWRYLFSLLVPTAVISMLSIYWAYRSLVKRRADRWYFWRRFLLTTITVIYIAYFDITQHVVRVFNHVCVYDATDPFFISCTRYWIDDTSIECYKGTHIVLVVIALVVLVVISIRFPLACSIALLGKNNEVSISNSRAHEMLGLLCGPFKQKYVYWECVTMLKKAILSIIIVFSYSLGNQAQGLLVIVVLVFFLTLHSTCYPFEEEFNILNYYEIGSLTTSCITYALVEFFNIERLSEDQRSLVSVAVIVLNVGFAIFMALTIVRNFVTFAKATLQSYSIVDIHDEISWFKTIKIYFLAWWFGSLSSTRNRANFD